ncbi:MAG: hypothetical protein CMH65_08110 [Nevskiales bacterium]|nr:hypothetical protein [Nevskiales bacterium]
MPVPRSRHVGCWSLALLMSIASSTSSAAQAEAEILDTIPLEVRKPDPLPPEDVDASLPVIVVTAQKRDERSRDVPMAVAAFSERDMDTLGVDNPLDLPRVMPGLVYNDFVGFSVIYLRGVGTDQFLPSGDSSVTTYIDGIYTPFAHALAQQFGKIERIEVLKGPQGTLYGRNSTGGAINVVTQAPGREPGLALSAQLGNFDARMFKAYVSGGIGDRVRVGLSLLDDRRSSYYRRPASSTREPFADETARGGQLRVDWDIADTLALDLSAVRTLQDSAGTALVSAFDTKPLFRLLVPESGADYQADPDVSPRLRAENDLVYARLRWSPTPFDVKLSASHQDVTTLTQFDFEGTPTPLATFRPTDMGARTTTAELQLLSNDGSLLSDRIAWTAGYYFFQGRDAGFRDVKFSLAESLTDPLIAPPLAAVDQLLDLVGLPLGVPDGVDLYVNGLVDTLSHSVYGQLRWSLGETIGLTLGGRYLWESRRLTESQVALMNADDTPSDIRVPFAPRRRSYRNFSPKVVLDHRTAGGSLLYASWQRGYKTGTFNVLNLLKPPSEVQPEFITTYEIGLKGEALDGRLNFGLAGFYNRIRDLQVLVLSLQSSGAVTLENAPETAIEGVEADIEWLPLPRALPGLLLKAGAMALHGRYTDYPEGSGFDPQTGLFRSGLDFTGNRTVRTPDLSATLGMRYRRHAPGGEMTFAASASFSDGYDFDAQNVARQSPYRTLQAQLTYAHARSGLSLSVFGENLTDDRVWLNQFQTDFNTVGTLGPPRLYGARLAFEF